MSTSPLAYVLDDDMDVSESLAMLLRSVAIDVETYGSVSTFLEGFSHNADKPCLLLLDVRMSEMSGMALLEKLRLDYPWLPIIMITGHGDIDMAVKAMKLGAKDFVTKPFSGQGILDRVQEVLRQSAEDDAIETHSETSLNVPQGLTLREGEIFRRLVAGEANKRIAVELGISVRTVESHRAHVMTKLGARTLVDLVKMSVRPSLTR